MKGDSCRIVGASQGLMSESVYEGLSSTRLDLKLQATF